MITLYILDLLILFAGGALIWAILPKDFKFELGAIVGYFLIILWIIFWFIYFVICGNHVKIE